MFKQSDLKKLADVFDAFSEPIDFDQLVNDGLLIRKGKSYFAPNVHALPDKLAHRIASVTPTKNGVRVTFSKEIGSAKKSAGTIKQLIK